jgi:arylsulfatase A-like enzyme
MKLNVRWRPAVSALLACVLAPPVGIAATGMDPVRLIDQAAANTVANTGQTIDSVWRRVVPSDPARFPLDGVAVPERPRLRFAIGLAPEPGEGRVRFEVLLEKGEGPPTPLYGREIARAGWIDEEIDLGGRDLEGADLLFRKMLVEGPRARLRSAYFGEPMLLPGRPRKAPSVILISIDTLRADRVGVYGWSRARTPALDELASEGVWYANAYSASSWTYPSHASLLHGLYPASLPQVEKPAGGPVGAGPPTLAETFRSGGYLTAGFTGGGFMSVMWGFERGFDTFYQFAQPDEAPGHCSPDRFDGPAVVARATRWLDDNGGNPFFLFVHTYDAHDRCEVLPAGLGFRLWPDPGPKERERVSRYYDDRIAAVDGLIARLLGQLDALGLADKTVIAVTSDHGEALWEHGYFGHGCPATPFEGMIKVPLIVRAPGHPRGRRIDQPVSAVDVAPTLLSLAGLTPPPGMQGYGLPGLGLASRPPSTPVFVHCDQNLAVRVGHYKLITSRKAGATDAVYDLDRDPDERENILAKSEAMTHLLREYAAEYWEKGSARAGGTEDKLEGLDEKSRERLRALGYVQ